MDEETTLGLSPDRLARLLAIGAEGTRLEDNLGAGQSPEELLRTILDSRLPVELTMPDLQSGSASHPGDAGLVAPSRSIGNLLVDPNIELAITKALKEYAKELVHCCRSDSERGVATAVYFAAIASALVFHQQKITQHSYRALDEAYAELKRKPWVSPQIADLFGKARTTCQQRREGA